MNDAKQEPDDRWLVRRYLRSRSEKSFLLLYRRYSGVLFQMALRLAGGNNSEAEEIVQETWIRATQRLADFAWRSTLRTWLIGIAVNVARERFRQRPREEPAVALQLVSRGRSATTKVDLERAIAGLAPGYRAVLLLFDVEGYTHHEIGQMIGIDPGTSKSQLSRARNALRQKLAASGGRKHA